MPRMLIIDTLYESFLKSIPFDSTSTFDIERRKVLDYQFGTADFFSRHLKQLGWTAIDIIANHRPLQDMWLKDHSFGPGDTLGAQLSFYEPDVVLMQDLSVELPYQPHFLVGQCSCAIPDLRNKYDLVLTSLPTHVKQFESIGIRCVFLPLAFEPSVLQGPQPERDIDVSFVGGMGRESHWLRGTDVMEHIADRLKDRFAWYGYGLDNLKADSPLRKCYRGPAWGREMYDIYRRSKIVVNRHGEIARGLMNNLRNFESTGMGAMLLTEDAPNIDDFFNGTEAVTYTSAGEAVFKIQYFLENDEEREWIAQNGQRKTLADHTYAKRMKVVSDTLMSMLVAQ